VAFYLCLLDKSKVCYTIMKSVMKWDAEVRTGLIWLGIRARRGRL